VGDARNASREPSAHILHVAGVDLIHEVPPVVRIDEVRETAVIVSRSRTLEREIHLDRCRADGVPVVVRPSGGGAVVLAPGMVTASVLAPRLPQDVFPESVFRRFVGAGARAIGKCVCPPVVMRGVSDLCVGDRKVAGSSLRMWAERVLFQTCVLVGPEISLFERYLPLPSRMPDYRGKRSHRSFVLTLAEAGYAGTPSAVVREMTLAIAAVLEDGEVHSAACV
jgi:lipoate-protein ligase A